ncbi:MAG: iron-sulfur cluster insertion protein ErpA [Gammaproteobacteria bacterium]|nr:MAG: iron-sulfur cluster insertion protein ErpA [Gammaproteobacteria bacterium]
MSADVEASTQMEFTDNAAKKVRQLIAEEGNDNLKLRVFITGGGCSGFSYGFKFDEAINDGDLVLENGGVQMVVDTLSIQYLMGATVDFVESLDGARFVIDNPNATTTCGCGSSFSV